MRSRPTSSRGSARSGSAGRAAGPRRSQPRTIASPASKPPSKAATTATRFRFFAGKGGVGKTTCAAAFAVREAARARVLVASLDPAHSLADALCRPLGPAPTRIPLANGRLFAVEIDAPLALNRWVAERRGTLEQLAVEGTWLDRDDVRRLLSLSLPGIDEIAALLEIERLSADSRFDLVVVDTAPTGHTLRLLDLPSTLGDIAVLFERMREKTRVMQAALEARRGGRPRS